MVRPHTIRPSRAMCLHVVCTCLREVDGDGSVLSVIRAELSIDLLARGGIDADVVNVGSIEGEGNLVLDGIANFGGLGPTHDQERGLFEVAHVSVEEVLAGRDSLRAEVIVLYLKYMISICADDTEMEERRLTSVSVPSPSPCKMIPPVPEFPMLLNMAPHCLSAELEVPLI